MGAVEVSDRALPPGITPAAVVVAPVGVMVPTGDSRVSVRVCPVGGSHAARTGTLVPPYQ